MTTINELGGEFRLIERLTQGFPDFHQVPLAIGDDAAVIRCGNDFLVATTDALVEGEHFRCDWSSARQIGIKTVEVNASDVAAMGARPDFLLLNLIVREGLSVEFLEELYGGILESCQRYGITLLGGDTTRGPVLMLSATLTGRTSRPVTRGGARPGDLICVTGDVGAAAAAVALWQAGLEPGPYLRRRSCEPRARLDVSAAIAARARALIDVSDGVASEVGHLCNRSGTGARILAGELPLHPETIAAARALGVAPQRWALSGGEDYELLFALAPEDEAPLRAAAVDFSVIGNFHAPEQGRWLVQGNAHEEPLPGGFDHFGNDKGFASE